MRENLTYGLMRGCWKRGHSPTAPAAYSTHTTVLSGTRDGHPVNDISGLNIHPGNTNPSANDGRTGSDGCHVIPRNRWDSFINKFGQGDSGKYIYVDVATPKAGVADPSEVQLLPGDGGL